MRRSKAPKALPDDPQELLDRLRFAAFRFLEYRPLTVKELRDRLSRKPEATPARVAAILEYCIREGYINEEEILIDSIRRAKEDQYIGRFLLRYQLTTRGLGEEAVMATITEHYSADDEIAVAEQFASRKMGNTTAGEDCYKQKQQVAAALYRRGFSPDTIYTVLRHLSFDVSE